MDAGLVIAVLLALTAYGALSGIRGWLRVPAAVLAASPYLAAAYLAQGAFKEPMLALAVLGFALALPAVRPAWSNKASGGGYQSDSAGDPSGGRAAIPLGVIAAGTIYNYSFPGLAWLLGAAIIWMLVIAIRERDATRSFIAGLRLRERLRGARAAIALGIGIPVVAAVPEIFGDPTSTAFTLSFLMCLIALVAALGFALLVPRRSANDLAEDAVLLPSHSSREPERTAA